MTERLNGAEQVGPAIDYTYYDELAEQDETDHEQNLLGFSELADASIATLRETLHPPMSLPEFLVENRPEYSSKDIPQRLTDLLESIDFKPRHLDWRIGKDIIGFLKRTGDDTFETLHEKLAREEARSGKTESATFGTATIEDQEVVVFAMQFDFFAGSLGEVAGQMFTQAIDLAKKKNLPFAGFYSSGGVRQQENIPGLMQMPRMAKKIDEFLEHVEQPIIAVLDGQAWGGVSATVTEADIVIGTAGSDTGFAGKKVITEYTGEKVPIGEQSVENHQVERNIDVVVRVEETVEYIGRALRLLQKPSIETRLRSSDIDNYDSLFDPERTPEGRRISFVEDGMAPALLAQQEELAIEEIVIDPPTGVDSDKPQAERLMEEFNNLTSNLTVDTEFLTLHCFDESLPLYNHYVRNEIKHYPAIIASVARIGEQSYMVIGNQPSMRKLGNKVLKIPASPGPKDYEYLERILETAERFDLPVISFTDTLGAVPTPDSERAGIARKIARSMRKVNAYKGAIKPYVTGGLGSGGGTGSTAFTEELEMLEGAHGYVSAPPSAAGITYKTDRPTPDEISLTLTGMRPTAEDQKDMGISRNTIQTGRDVWETAENIRRSIIESTIRQQSISQKLLQKSRDRWVRGLQGFDIIKGRKKSNEHTETKTEVDEGVESL